MDELFLLKLTKPRSALTFTQVQKISLPNNLKTSFVTKMKLYGTGASTYVYIGTENNIYRVPVQSCSDYTTCFSCVQARDPYCGFNKGSLSCTSSVQAVESNTYLQDLENGNATICNDIESTTSQTSTTSGSVSVIDRESTAVPRDGNILIANSYENLANNFIIKKKNLYFYLNVPRGNGTSITPLS